MTGWCPYKKGPLQESECHFDGYCEECPHNKESEDAEKNERRSKMGQIPKEKIERNKHIVEMRKSGHTLKEIAKEVKLTISNVRSITEREEHYDFLREKFPKILTGEHALSMWAFNPIIRRFRVMCRTDLPYFPEDSDKKEFNEENLVDFLLHASDEELLSIRNVGVKTLSEIENWRSHYAKV